MLDGEPGWFYVGNGELRYKDSDGWTDRYQDIDGPAKTSDVEPSTSPNAPGSGIAEVGRGSRDPSSFTKLCASMAHLSIAGFSRLLVGLWRWIVRFSRLLVGLWRPLITSLSRLLVGLWPWIVGLSRLLVGLRRPLITSLSRLLVGLWPWIVGLSRLLVGLWPWIVRFSRLLVGLWRPLITGIRRLLVGLRRWTVGLSRLLVGLWRPLITGISRLLVGLRRWTVGLSRLLVGLWRPLITGIRRLLVGLRRWTAGFWRLIAEGYQRARTRLSIRSVARRHRGPSKSSVLVEALVGLMKRSGSGHPRSEIVRHRLRFLLGSGQNEEEEEPNFFVHLDPERLIDLNPNVAGVDQRVPNPGNGIEAEPIVDS